MKGSRNTIRINPASGKQTIKVDEDKLEIIPLGAGCEVGRSCVIVSFKGKTVMFDCGIHPAKTGLASLPFFDKMDPASVDLVLISHFHLDHVGSLPYFTQKTDFSGKIVMTHATKAIYKLLLTDFVKVSDSGPSSMQSSKGGKKKGHSHTGNYFETEDSMLFNEKDLQDSLPKIEVIDYHQEKEHKGIKYWCYNAGHVLGACMFMIEIAGIRVLYTGDFSCVSDRHLLGAEIPTISPDVLIVEATYGNQVHEPRVDREERFTSSVANTVKNGGKCLIPVFALGRVQELLLILDQFWEKNPELHGIPIYYASTLARKSMHVFRTYINMMNSKIQKQFEISNPFEFKHIQNLKSVDQFDDSGPCVVMAAPGMLQSGVSRQLFESWCQNKKNSVVITGYCVENTLAKDLMSEPKKVKLSNGMEVDCRIKIVTISFSAHSDRQQTEAFISYTRPEHAILVHGEISNCKDLKNSIVQRFSKQKRPKTLQEEKNPLDADELARREAEKYNIHVYTPRNTDKVRITIKGQKIAKVLGLLATEQPDNNKKIEGVLLQKDFQQILIDKSELKQFADISCVGFIQKMKVPLPDVSDFVLNHMIPNQKKKAEKMENNNQDNQEFSVEEQIPVFWLSILKRRFQVVEFEKNDKKAVNFRIGRTVRLEIETKSQFREATMIWESSSSKDMLVESICAFLLDSDLVADAKSGILGDFDEENLNDVAKIENRIEDFAKALFSSKSLTKSMDIEEENKEENEEIKEKMEIEEENKDNIGINYGDRVEEMRMVYIIIETLKEQFENIKIDVKMRKIFVINDLNETAQIDFVGKIVDCPSTILRARLEYSLKRVLLTSLPLPCLSCLDEL